MGISLKDVKLLWGRSANRCAICRVELSQDSVNSNESYPLGEQAHIVSKEVDGPRGKSILTSEERDSYRNLILLCPTHHTEVDKNEYDYPVEKLHMIKSQHEDWVRYGLLNNGFTQVNSLGTDGDQLLNFVREWMQFCDFYFVFHNKVDLKFNEDLDFEFGLDEQIESFQEWHKRIKSLRELLFHLGEETLLVKTVNEWEDLKQEDDYLQKRDYQSPFSYMIDFEAPVHSVVNHGDSMWKAWQISYRFLEYLSFKHENVKEFLSQRHKN